MKSEFRTSEPVVFETEVYNDLYERVYGDKIDLKLTNESGKETSYSYVPTQSNTRYAINGLDEGVYKYQASTSMEGETVRAMGEFLVKEIQLEKLNLTADFNLLRKISDGSGGEFFLPTEFDKLDATLGNEKAQAVIHSNEKYLPFINLQWIFVLILILVSTEWFIRKFSGSY